MTEAVVDSIRRKRIGNYWRNTETYESLKKYISMNSEFVNAIEDAGWDSVMGAICASD